LSACEFYEAVAAERGDALVQIYVIAALDLREVNAF
jgi:hypothetical protein